MRSEKFQKVQYDPPTIKHRRASSYESSATTSRRLYGQGKSGEERPFHLGQGKPRMPAMIKGEMALSYSRSCKMSL